MACSLDELQQAEFEMLCVLDDVCSENGINFVLQSGTTLGAVRHHGFIPWDDDVDVMMTYRNYKKLKKVFKNHNNRIRGISLSDYELDPQTPHCLPKLRLIGSVMPEPSTEGVDMMQGVWLDLFLYCNRAKGKWLQMLQDMLFRNTVLAHKKYKNRWRMAYGDTSYMDTFMCKLCEKLPDGLRILLIRMMQFGIVTAGSKNSSFYFCMSSYITKQRELERCFLDNTVPIRFEGRDFPVPMEYDRYLRKNYGDNYMTPIRYNAHTDLSTVILPRGGKTDEKV